MRFGQCSHHRIKQRIDAYFDWDFLQNFREGEAMVDQTLVSVSTSATPRERWEVTL